MIVVLLALYWLHFITTLLVLDATSFQCIRQAIVLFLQLTRRQARAIRQRVQVILLQVRVIRRHRRAIARLRHVRNGILI